VPGLQIISRLLGSLFRTGRGMVCFVGSLCFWSLHCFRICHCVTISVCMHCLGRWLGGYRPRQARFTSIIVCVPRMDYLDLFISHGCESVFE